MKKNFFNFDKNQKYIKRFEYYPYLYFRYNRLFFRSLIFRGRKLWAFNFLIELRYVLKTKERVDPFWLILIAFMKITPEVLLFPKKLGGVIQGVPLAIGERKQYTFAIKWVVKLIRDKYKKVNIINISETLINAIYDKGDSFEKKLSVYKLSTNNRHLIRFFR